MYFCFTMNCLSECRSGLSVSATPTFDLQRVARQEGGVRGHRQGGVGLLNEGVDGADVNGPPLQDGLQRIPANKPSQSAPRQAIAVTVSSLTPTSSRSTDFCSSCCCYSFTFLFFTSDNTTIAQYQELLLPTGCFQFCQHRISK